MRRSFVWALVWCVVCLAAQKMAAKASAVGELVDGTFESPESSVHGGQMIQEGDVSQPVEDVPQPVEGEGSELAPEIGQPIIEEPPSPPLLIEGNWPTPSPPVASRPSKLYAKSKPRSRAEYCMSEYRHKQKRYVTTSQGLRSALRSAKAGDMIFVKDGTYTGSFEIRNKKGNVWRPITICGSPKAIIHTKNNVGLLLHKTTYVNVVGLTVKNASKGIRLETAVRCTLDKVTVTNTGAEGIHIQYRSHYNTVKNSNISNAGRKIRRVGEGIYLGSSSRNVRRDVCVGNKILNNKITGTRAEPIDVKEYTRDGVISGNYLDGSRLCKCPDATSLINVKGNGYRIENNMGKNAIEEFYKTSTVRGADGQGRNNVFKNNKCLTPVRGKRSCVRKPGGGLRGNKFY